MGVKKTIKSGLARFAKMEATRLRRGAGVVDFFVPGLGTVSKKVADLYDKLSPTKKKQFHSATGKKAKEKILRSK